MISRRTILIGAVLSLAAVLAVGKWLADTSGQAPALTFQIIDGRRLALDSLRGRPVLVTFWSTTCPACVAEIPHLVELYRMFQPAGLEIIGVAMAYDPPSHVLRLVKNRGVIYPVALDLDGSVAGAFGDVELTPTSFLLAPDGRIAQRTVGKMDMARLEGAIRRLLYSEPVWQKFL